MKQEKGERERERVSETLLCVVAVTASHQHGFEACTVCGRSGDIPKLDRAVQNLHKLVKNLKVRSDRPPQTPFTCSFALLTALFHLLTVQ
jgi:hypothetical protein